MRRRVVVIIAAVILALIGLGTAVAPFYVDLLWFNEVGYKNIFFKNLLTGLSLGLGSGIKFFIFIYINLLITRRFAPKYWYVSTQPFLEKVRQFFRKAATMVILAISSVLAIFAGIAASNQYDKLLKYLNATSFGITDPVFNIDVSFYVFKLPFYEFIFGWIVALLITTGIAIMVIYLFDGSIEVRPNKIRLLPHVKAHLSVILALLLAAIAINYRLQMYELLYSTRGVVSGASYTDVHANLPVLWILFVTAIISAIIVLLNINFKGWLYPAIGVGILLVTSLLVGSVYPAFVQNYRVAPNELRLEKPYIKRSIEHTRKAYGLNTVKQVEFKIDNALTLAEIQNSQATIDNIRLWDWRPLLDTYRQIQEIRPYYVFNDVDVDRYVIDGKKRQVALAARELSTEKLQESRGSWVNKHMIYTHGYGLTMNAVNEVSAEGLPEFLVKDLPPVSKSKDLKISQPRIYYGEAAKIDDYAIVNTKNAEFDYPAQDKNVSTKYKGSGGFKIDSFIKRLALAYTYSDVNIAISGDVSANSSILLNRNVLDRVNKIAPFITFDDDPYIVIDKGALYWVVDGYTTSNKYPYSQGYNPGYNYIRNSVKTVVSAYNGTVNFYVADSKDPIIKTYSKIYSGSFKPLAAMPDGLKKHLRYPEDLFGLQSEVFATYHVTEPNIFYSKEDRWDVPREIFQSTEQMVEPYYVILQLAESKNDFQLIRPFTPIGKSNMISWMSINSEPDAYGKILLYQFSKKELVFGPAQVEARIDQNPDISERFTLWNQSGSTVIRGNLLVIPIKNSLLFVEPIYLQSSQSQIPELVRVIAVLGNKVAMGTNFDEAISNLFSGQKTVPKEEKQEAPPVSQTQAQLIQQAGQLYSEAIQAQKEGDWTTYGQKIKELGKVLDRLKST